MPIGGDVGLLSGLSSGLESGLNAYMKERDREEDRLQRDLERRNKQKEFKFKIKSEGFEEDPTTGEIRESEARKQQKALETASKGAGFLKYGIKPKYNSETGQVEYEKTTPYIDPLEQSKIDLNKSLMAKYNRSTEQGSDKVAQAVETHRQKGLLDAQVPNYEVADPNVIPDETQKRKFQDSIVSKVNLEDSLNKVKNNISKNGVQGALVSELNPFTSREALESKAEIDRESANITTQAKELFHLGVLSEQDDKIIQNAFGKFSGLKAGRLGSEAVIRQVDDALDRLNKGLSKQASILGYRAKSNGLLPQDNMQQNPLANQNQQQQINPQGMMKEANAGAPPPSNQLKKGDVVFGKKYLGGDPKSPQAWE